MSFLSSLFSKSLSRGCALGAALLLVASVSGCASNYRVMEEKPTTQSAGQSARQNAGQSAATKSAKAPGVASSRLDAQPWPPGMGQPVTGQTAAPAPAPAVPAKTAPSYQDQTLASMRRGARVAILLPLSGKNAPMGQAMLNAAQMAVFDMGGASFELMPRDTAPGAEAAARDAMASGAQLLIGPLFAADVAAIRPLVQSSSVNMLALSSDVSLAEPGAYVMGFAPASQVKRVVAYAAHAGAQRFAALVPADAYGKLVEKAFHAAVAASGGKIVAVEGPQNIQALAAKKDEIDAVLIAFGGPQLKQIAGQLAALGMASGKIRLLGTGLWDDPTLGQTPALIGGWFATAEPDARAAFVTSYKETYGAAPPRLATLAYDATALAAVLARQGLRFDRAALASPSGFAGLDGLFRLTPSGEAERGLAIGEISAQGMTLIDPAPESFAAP